MQACSDHMLLWINYKHFLICHGSQLLMPNHLMLNSCMPCFDLVQSSQVSDFVWLHRVFCHVVIFLYTACPCLMDFGLCCRERVKADTKRFYSRLLSPEISQGAADYYVIMLFFDVLCFITIIFGISSFGVSLITQCKLYFIVRYKYIG